jgi:NADPH:quinone reductase-like Zn-dependent oxidoreductase
MKAVGVTGPDFTPRLFDIDEPIAGPDEVVVDVLAASVNDFDRAAIGGRYVDVVGHRGRLLLGRDVVGRVSAVGQAVDYLDVGMRVAGALPPQATQRPGTFTDSVAVPAEWVAPIPDGIDVAHAAAVGLAGIAALDAFDARGAAQLGSVVIHGPVAEIGGFAIQLAKAHGALVAAITVPEQVDLAWELGADVVIPESADPPRSIQAVRQFFGGAVDFAIHVAGDLSVAAGVIRPGGCFTSVDDATMRATSRGGGYVPTIVAPSGHRLADLLFKVAAHRLSSSVGRAVSFDQVADAVDPGSGVTGGRVVVVR